MAPPPPTPPPPPTTAGCLSVRDAEAELEALGSREQELELEIERLYGRAAHLCQSESRSLTYVGEQHKQVPAAIRKLQETLQQTSTVADELSGRVRRLDAVCINVSEALRLVDDVLDLRECSDQVMKAISSEDFEQAAKYVSRFRASQGVLPPGTDDTSVRVLREAEQQLSVIVRKRFESAMSAKDNASVSRFAKLFHPLGLAGEGVQKYVQFIRNSLAERCNQDYRLLAPAFGKRADASPTQYAEALTKVFVAIADIVGEHQQEVEQEFGPENFIVVLRGLLDEADAQGLRVIEKFLTDHTSVFDQQESCEMRVTGIVLEETALLTQRTQQFTAYVHGVGQSVVEMIADDDRPAFIASLPEGHSETDGLMELTRLVRRIQELVSKYVILEQTFLLQSVAKATTETDSLDVTDPEQLTTTMVDDTFFVLQQSMLRAITTCDINAVCAVVNYVNAAIGGEVRTALLNSLAESKQLYGRWVGQMKNLTTPASGEHPLATLFLDQEGKQRSPLTANDSWPHALNNLQQCVEYLDRLKGTTEEAFDEYFPSEGPDKDKHVIFQQCLAGLDATKGELESVHSQTCKAGLLMIKGHLSPMLNPLETLDFQISEAKYSDLQVNDPFAKAFIAHAAVLHTHLRSVLNPVSCEELMQHMADQTCRRIEREALKKNFTLFGALQFDSDVRALCSFFTSVSEQALRHKFARLFEMSSLLNLESVAELRDLYGEMRSWRLSADEIKTLVSSRVDFDASQAELEMLLNG